MKLIIDIDEEVYKGLVDDTHVFAKPIFDAIKNGTPIPDNATVCDIEQIRAEIKHLLNRPSLTHVVGYDKGFVDGIDKVMQIIDKYRKSEE